MITPEHLALLRKELEEASQKWSEADNSITEELIQTATHEQLVPFFEKRDELSHAYMRTRKKLREAQAEYLREVKS